MAKKKTKARGAASATPGKRGRKPVPPYPHVFDFRRPSADPKTELELGKAFYGPDSKTPPPNAGIMSATALKASADALRAAEDNGEIGPSTQPIYSLIRRGIAAERRATVVITGQKSKGAKPKAAHNVPASITKNWAEGDRVHVDGNNRPVNR